MHLGDRVWSDWRYFIAFGFGSGLAKFAPGTVGTLAAVPIYLILQGLNPWLYAFLTLVLFALGVYVSSFVSSELGQSDYKGIVIDEIVGYLITLFMMPCHFGVLLLAFVLFRFFDICKPFPIRYIDKHVDSGLGVMLDDVVAGIMAYAVLKLFLWGGLVA